MVPFIGLRINLLKMNYLEDCTVFEVINFNAFMFAFSERLAWGDAFLDRHPDFNLGYEITCRGMRTGSLAFIAEVIRVAVCSRCGRGK